MPYHELYINLSNTIIKENESLSNHTHTKTGGVADVVLFPTNVEDVKLITKFAYEKNVPLTILGNGSNVIIKDSGIRGMTLILTQLNSITVSEKDTNLIIAQAGASIIDTSKFALDHRLTGLEFACGIPGSVGGAVYMNAGAYGGQMADVLEKVDVLTKEGEVLTLKREDLDLKYRSSIISEKNYIVLQAFFKLKNGVQTEIKSKMDELTFLRESKQPLEYPSCGSVFKRPPNLFAGKLIQDAGLQGTRIGGVEVSTKHAGFMVNVENGTATDYINLIQHVQQQVKKTYGVELELEVKILGE